MIASRETLLIEEATKGLPHRGNRSYAQVHHHDDPKSSGSIPKFIAAGNKIEAK